MRDPHEVEKEKHQKQDSEQKTKKYEYHATWQVVCHECQKPKKGLFVPCENC